MKNRKALERLIGGCILACFASQLLAQNEAIPWDLSARSSDFFRSASQADAVQAEQSGQSDPLQIEINSLPKVPPSMIPKSGTFWSLQGILQCGAYPPLPFNPSAATGTDSGVTVYSFADGSFLMNDLNVDYASIQPLVATKSGGPNLPSPQPQGKPEVIDYAWLTLNPPAGGNGGQLTVDTADWGGGWIWGVVSITNLLPYDPRLTSWQLMDPTYFSYDLDGNTYAFSMPPFDKPMEFYRTFDIQDYFQGYWTPIKYLGCNLATGESVTTNDVVMRFSLEGDIYRFYTNTSQSVQATVVRPSGESVGCFANISPDGIATITAPASSFAFGTNYVWVSFVNEGPQYVDAAPSQPIDETYLANLDVPNQEGYLTSLGVNPPVTGNTTNHQPHGFTGYLVFNAVPPIEDSVAAAYVSPYVNGGTLFSRTYKCKGGVNASFTVQLLTPDNQLIAETNGVTQLDANNEYTFEADLTIPDEVIENIDSVTALVQAQPIPTHPLAGGARPNDNPPPSANTINYILDKTKFRGIYNTAAWCSMDYQVPFPANHPWQVFWYDMDWYLDGFLEHSADSILTDIGLLFQTGFSQAIPDPYVLDSKPSYKYDGSQVAHFANVLTNSLYMGINFLSHSGAGVDLFDDPNLPLSVMAKAIGNTDYVVKAPPGQPVSHYYAYKRRLDVWMEASCGGAWRYDAEYFGTPRNVDQTHAPVPPTVAFGYDVQNFTPVIGCPHFEELGNQFYLSAIFGDRPLKAFEAIQIANQNCPAGTSLNPAYQGNPNKTASPNSLQ